MNKLIFAGAAALAFAAVPAVAQDVAVDANGNVYVLTDTQQADYDGWPVDRRSAYDGWPYGVQEYYWTLTPVQVPAWWVLTDDQRVRVYEMTPQQRDAAWTGIMNQVTSMAEPEPAPAATQEKVMRFVSNEKAQTAPAPKTDYPICEEGMTDGCINEYEARGTGNRPINYWPGRPASEIDEPLPVDRPEPAAQATEPAEEEPEG